MDELRNRLNRAMNDSLYRGDGWDALVGIILAEIEAAGYSIVKTDRLERLLELADYGLECINHRDGPLMVPYQAVHLKAGDLDPITEVQP